jgi:hypothetical protein
MRHKLFRKLAIFSALCLCAFGASAKAQDDCESLRMAYDQTRVDRDTLVTKHGNSNYFPSEVVTRVKNYDVILKELDSKLQSSCDSSKL